VKGLFYIFFAFYFLFLSVIPCGDKEGCNEFQQAGFAQTTHHEDHNDEVCTPFCVCSCCATHFVATSIESQFIVTSAETQCYADPATSKVNGAVLPIWQPPKLA
jgi:hypothetical protein